MTEKLRINLIPTQCGRFVGHVELNKPKALNALDLDMARAMQAQLDSWRNDESVLLVLISGTGEKAFCAGGDIVSMYQSMQTNKQEIPDFISEFFTREYRLDYTIHSYPKPVIAWGEGIVMGGGIGLLAGASHRIFTPATRLAMPEITIGLYPDVGASYFLPRAPGHTGLFLGLTGASVNASDGLFVGLGDYVAASGALPNLIKALGARSWRDSDIASQLSELCQAMSVAEDELPPMVLAAHQSTIDESLGPCNSAPEAVKAILSMPSADDEWLAKVQHSLRQGSPITMHLVWEQIQRGRHLSLAECFKMELIMSCRCAESGEFAEGVRALLIDKDKTPHWQFSRVEEVPEAVVKRHFASPWETHPLTLTGEE
ncbi:enoyl-CoA hydratase/isomerase family protein [Alteromonas lipolytica]|uniref:3-hydroxyisobutyryl-CoA hydrolase n=1 Tax=Alteromonas lipolytica TaxID=1856405 RepID=A0A1E8FGR3_9ALTE|nr:enoyl-CoA hydratase/isomerase family protein [Alteromonas lipolytica]OFI35104.1 enoyl-CoA hydratase [Alteromonas lipolytica]GGF56719.1 enoyl-CoA hydratase [Alteromonas lipolytica]